MYHSTQFCIASYALVGPRAYTTPSAIQIKMEYFALQLMKVNCWWKLMKPLSANIVYQSITFNYSNTYSQIYSIKASNRYMKNMEIGGIVKHNQISGCTVILYEIVFLAYFNLLFGQNISSGCTVATSSSAAKV